jgi:hypothetical protein
LPEITPRDQALALLVGKGVPVPSAWVPDFPLPSGLFILKEVVEGVMIESVRFFDEMRSDGDEVDDVAASVQNALAAIMVGATMALVALGLLPQEAEDALIEAQNG